MLKKVIQNFLDRQDKPTYPDQELMSHESLSREQLLILVDRLQSRLALLESERASLNWLLETTKIEYHKVTNKLHPQSQKAWSWELEIDQNKREFQVAEITKTDYFQQLEAELIFLKYPDEED
jgi:hypothetical protein